MAKILVVDDDSTILSAVEGALKRTGHTVVLASDGHEGLEVAKNEFFDLIVTDANMPGGLSGFNLVATLRTLKRYKDTPIIFMTGRRDKKDVERALESDSKGRLMSC